MGFTKRTNIKNIIPGKAKIKERLFNEIRLKLNFTEKEICDFYRLQIDEFRSNYLFRKRYEDIKQELHNYSSLISDATEINKVFSTTHIPLNEHREYLEKRLYSVDHINSSKPGQEETLHKHANNDEKPPITLPPEKTYLQPRKIDWDSINKQRLLTGKKGEHIVLMLETDYLKSNGRLDLANKVVHVSDVEGDDAGYDIHSFFLDGRAKYIEVKSSTLSIDTPFYLSANELNFLKSHLEDYFLYRIFESGDQYKDLLKVFSASEILNSNSIIPSQYIVKM